MILLGICKRGLKKKLANLSKKLPSLCFFFCAHSCAVVCFTHVDSASILFSFGHHSTYVLIVTLWELVAVNTAGFCSYCYFF